MMQHVYAAQAWFYAHPAVTGWLTTALVTALVRLPSEPAWQRFKERHTRLAALLQLLRGLGIDANKVAFWSRVLLTGQIPPGSGEAPRETRVPPASGSSSPSGGDLAARVGWVAPCVAAAAIAVAVAVSGCGPRPWSDTAHAAINTTAHAVAAGDETVAAAIARDARTSPYDALEARYRPAVVALASLREALLAAQSAVDAAAALPASTARRCAARVVLGAVEQQAANATAALRTAGVDVPPEVATGVALCARVAATLAPACASDGAATLRTITAGSTEVRQ